MQLVAYYVSGFVVRMRTERGQDLLEYAMLGGLIAAAILAIFAVLMGAAGGTGAIQSMADGIANCIDFDATTDCKAGL